MGCVVCATRGGEGSRAAQEEAIRYAQERQKTLLFLYVIDFKSLDQFDGTLLLAVRNELNWLGQTLLQIACHRAEQAGVPAEAVIREGDVRLAIEEFLQERKAEILFLGATRTTTANVFGDDAIEHFAQKIEEDTGVRVEIARPEAVSSEDLAV